MTVWIENPFDNLPREGSRPLRYWLMARAFAQRGHRVIYWTSSFSHTGKVPRRLPEVFVADGIEVHLVPTPPYKRNIGLKRILSHRAYAKAWRKLATHPEVARPEVLIVSTPPLATGNVARHLARQFGAKLVVDIQDAWPETFYRLLPRFIRGIAPILFAPQLRAVKKLLNAADLVTAVSARYVERARHLGKLGGRLFYHGIDLANWSTPPIRGSETDPLLVYIGGVGANYDLGTVLRALKWMPHTKLAIAGVGKQVPTLKAYAQKEGLAERVTFCGYLDEQALRALLRSAAVGIIPLAPSSWVGVPYKFADYAAAGLAVLSSLKGETQALLAKYAAGESYAAGSAASFKAAYERLLPHLEAARQGARRLAEAEFDAAKIYGEYVRTVEGRVAK